MAIFDHRFFPESNTQIKKPRSWEIRCMRSEISRNHDQSPKNFSCLPDNFPHLSELIFSMQCLYSPNHLINEIIYLHKTSVRFKWFQVDTENWTLSVDILQKTAWMNDRFVYCGNDYRKGGNDYDIYADGISFVKVDHYDRLGETLREHEFL